MAQTRAQGAAKRGRIPEDQDQDAPTRKRQRRQHQKTHHKSWQERPIKAKSQKQAIEESPHLDNEQSPKHPQILTSSAAAADDVGPIDPVDLWRREGRWPNYYSEPDMEHILGRKRSSSALSGRKRSNSATSTTPSDQKPREEKSAQYRDPRYETLLQTKGTFMETSDLDITDKSKKTCRDLLRGIQSTPQGSIFDDAVFQQACKNLQNKNEARIIQDMSKLIVPSAETLALYNKHLALLAESVNEGWNNSIPLTGTRPQPDYSVGFRRDAFTDNQLAKLSPFIGEFLNGDLSFFMATYYMYFPFLACEVKCGAAALDIADRQNAHSMTLAARGIVELFRLVGREGEVHRQILAFSISHDHRSVRIYGYYPVIDKKDTKYYRHPINTFDFTALDGKEKWAAYRFTKNIYDNWMTGHFKRICSAIEQLPSKVDFNVVALSESTGLSQSLGNLPPLEDDPTSLLVDEDKAGQMATPDTSCSQPAPAKRRRNPVKTS